MVRGVVDGAAVEVIGGAGDDAAAGVDTREMGEGGELISAHGASLHVGAGVIAEAGAGAAIYFAGTGAPTEMAWTVPAAGTGGSVHATCCWCAWASMRTAINSDRSREAC